MNSTIPTQAVSSKAVWIGRVLTGLIVIFMIFDAGVKLLKLPAAVEGTVRLGYPAEQIVPLGVVVLVCVALYAIPRTAVLGAILLTGYLGGATAT
jgi:DoxX-like family